MVRRQAFDSGKGSTSGESRQLCIGDSHSCARKTPMFVPNMVG